MIDFNKQIKNSNKFRKPALTFVETGSYCSYPKGSSEYYTFWDKEVDRCINGFTVEDGDFITGYHYFYLNYCPIVRQTYQKVINRKTKLEEIKSITNRDFPDFYDYDYYYFQAIEEAQDCGKHLCVAKARRKGFSYKGGAMLCRNFFLVPESKSYVYASNKQYLTDDGILTKAWDYMDFIDEHTAWGKKRQVANTSMRRRASMLVTDEYGNKIEVGFKSEIIGLSLKDNPDAVRGKKGVLILWEEAGSFSELSAAWQIARPSVEHDGVAFGLMIAFGTGGDQGEAVRALREAFYDPDSFNCLGFINIWDESAEGGKKCGFFVPQHTNLDSRDANNSRIYMDADGNTIHSKARDYILTLRAEELKNAKTSQAIDRYVAEHSECPAEAFTELTGNIFPKRALQKQLAKIRTNRKLQNHKQVGDLLWDNGSVRWVIKKHGDILEYPLSKNTDPTGSIVIWEHPVQEPPIGLYIAGCLTPGEKVLTDCGLMNVEDVTLENKLVSRTGEYVDIRNLQRYNKVDENVYKIKPYGAYRTTTFTGEHPILLSNDTFVKATDLKVGDQLVLPNRYHKVKQDYKNIIKEELGVDPDDPRLWRFFGMWLGDGFNNINSNSYDVYMAFGKNQKSEADSYTKLIDDLFERKTILCKANGGNTRRFTHKQLVLFLDKRFGKYSYGKYIQEWVKYTTAENKIHFLHGYLDADGSVFKDRGDTIISFTSVNLELLESFQSILYSVGICSAINLKSAQEEYTVNNKLQQRRSSYILKLSKPDVKKFSADPEKTLSFKALKISSTEGDNKKRKPRKYSISACGNWIFLNIQSIDVSTYTGIVYNFECDTHTYMCHDIVTHNCDPYDHDQSGTNSLGSCFIYKRFQDFESYSDVVVAEYTGRPKTAEDFYENVRKLLVYYNARLLYENQNKGLFAYFSNKHCDYLLADQPDIINDIVKDSKVQRKKGCHMNKDIKLWGEGKIKEWLEEETGEGHMKLETLLSEPFLEELIKYNDKGNFDRVMAYMQVMIYREQLYTMQVKQKSEDEKKQRLFDIPIFTQEWYNQETASPQENKIFNTITYSF